MVSPTLAQRVRWRTRRAVSGRRVHIGVSTRNASSRRMRSTFMLPITGWAWRSKVAIQSFAASGSPPKRASRRFSNAWARASASETSGKPPNPRSWRRRE